MLTVICTLTEAQCTLGQSNCRYRSYSSIVVLFTYAHHYIKTIVVCLSICLSITGGQQKQSDLEIQDAASLATERLQARARQFMK